MARPANRYVQIMEKLFLQKYRRGLREVPFDRSDISRVAQELAVVLPKNLGDVLYSFRYRVNLPELVRCTAPSGYQWMIRPAGRSRYKFVLATQTVITPSGTLVETKIPDATPGAIAMYCLTDEQALLARIRYNRLLDIFTGLACYSLQSHLRTSVPSMGQVETDEVYVGIDKRGAHYVLPVQAKDVAGRIGVVQIEQDVEVCAVKFPVLICRPIAAQLMGGDLIALFELEKTGQGIRVSSEKHYRLVPPDQLSMEELASYRKRPLT